MIEEGLELSENKWFTFLIYHKEHGSRGSAFRLSGVPISWFGQ